MPIYPSLEDMHVDHLAHAQTVVDKQHAIEGGSASSSTGSLYSGLGLEELLSYGGLDISRAALDQHMGREVATMYSRPGQPGYQPLAAVTASNNVGIARAEVKQGVRPVVVAKDAKGVLGVAPVAIDKGIFVGFVWKDSPAALAGMRFGDQILQINGESVAGWTQKKTLAFLRKADAKGVLFAVRDRPFARALTFQKDAQNYCGFVIKDGEVTKLVQDSSASRNGLLINHHVLEVNGQNVVGLKDKDVVSIIQDSPVTVTITVIPTFVYKHLIKNIGYRKIKEYMDHSIPEC
eukprot:m.28219 g.28219  ORF g.28219 m.28219 type:complete len:292 (+) comp13559_c0_seq1:178-1053(+)